MTKPKIRRVVAILSTPDTAAAAPPGVPGGAYATALLEDVCDLVGTMNGVTAVIAACPRSHARAASAAGWPGGKVLGVDADGDTGSVVAVFDAVAALGVAGTRTEVAVVAGDAPDLPPLLLGKLFAALDRADAAACPAEGGGLVALGGRLPLAGWVRRARASLDTPDALDLLAAAAPNRSAFTVGPGWRRQRHPADVARLDPGLEGWEATRLLLEGHARRPTPKRS